MSSVQDTPASTSVAEWIFLLVGLFILLVVAFRIIGMFQTKNQQRTVTGSALVVGVIVSLGISPFGTIAGELGQLSDLLPAAYPEWVMAFLSIETALGLLFGIGVMWESGGPWATGSFILALIAGIFLPYSLGLSVVMAGFAWFMMELSPADRW